MSSTSTLTAFKEDLQGDGGMVGGQFEPPQEDLVSYDDEQLYEFDDDDNEDAWAESDGDSD